MEILDTVKLQVLNTEDPWHPHKFWRVSRDFNMAYQSWKKDGGRSAWHVGSLPKDTP